MLVLEEDGTVRDEVCRNRASRDGGEGVVTCMTWTASQLQGGNVLLGVGWKDGSVMLWSEKERMERTDEDQHGGHPISFVYFSPDNTRMISADTRSVPSGAKQTDAAVVCVFKVG